MPSVFVGDVVQVRGVVRAVAGDQITIRLTGYGIPITFDMSNVVLVATAPLRRNVLHDRSD